MSSAGKGKKKSQKNGKKPIAQKKQNTDLVEDTAAIFTCSWETAADFASQCDSAIDAIECDLTYHHLAHEIWSAKPGALELTAVLADYQSELGRHIAVLRQLQARFASMCTETAPHEHLDPIEKYRELVRQRLFPE
jgi:hypothetical protein